MEEFLEEKKMVIKHTVESQGVFWQRDAVQGAQSADFGLCDWDSW